MRRLPIFVLVLLGLAACPVSKPAAPKDRGMKPIGIHEKAQAVVAQGSVDQKVPHGIDAYEAWQVSWVGSQPMSLILERFVRGRCFAEKHYALKPGGMLMTDRFLAKAGAAGIAPTKDQVLLAASIDRLALKSKVVASQRDPMGRLAWTYRIEPSSTPHLPDTEVVTQFSYHPKSCALPDVIQRTEVPAKIRPVGVTVPGPKGAAVPAAKGGASPAGAAKPAAGGSR